MIEQFVIALTAFASLAAFAAQRTLVGSIIGLIGVPFWIYAVTNEQWGICIAIGLNTTVYLTSVLLRLTALRRKQKFIQSASDDDGGEYNHLSDAM